MGKDYILGKVHAEQAGPIWDVAIPTMGGTPEFQVFEDLDTALLMREPMSKFVRLSNGMYLYRKETESRFWYDVYLALGIRDRQPDVARYHYNRNERDALEREIQKRGGMVMVRGGDDPAGVPYFHDDMLRDLGKKIVRGIEETIEEEKASKQRSRRCVCTPPAKRRTPAKRKGR